MLLQVDSTKVSYTEYFYEGGLVVRPILFLTAFFSKLFRYKLAPSTDIPPVENLLNHLVGPRQLDPDLCRDLQPQLDSLSQSGFDYAGTISLYNPTGSTRYGGHVLFSRQTGTIAWIRTRRMAVGGRPAATAMLSLTSNGEVVSTTAARRDLLDPADWNIEYHPGLTEPELMEFHHQHKESIPTGSFRPVNSPDEALALLQSVHQRFIKFQIQRGVFVREDVPVANVADTLTRNENSHESTVQNLPDDSTELVDEEIRPYVAAVREIENKQTHWISKLALLAVSIGAFIALGAFAWDWQFVISLIPILFVHELGHFVAMKLFGYRNVQMFFIPLFGAAVSGRHYNVAAWKKAMVALAGPVPSIFLAIALGIVGIIWELPWTQSAVGLTLILNALNLLPFLPLDGGWVAHTTLFSRSAILDLVFRIITVVGLAGMAYLFQSRFMFFMAVFFGFSIQLAWKTSTIVQKLRQQPVATPGEDKIPVAAIEQIIPEIQAANISVATPKQYAQQVITIYESVISSPPGVLASFAILSIHAISLLAAIVFGIVMAVYNMGEQFGGIPDLKNQSIEIAGDHQSNVVQTFDQPSCGLMVWTFATPEEAQREYEHLVETREGSTTRIGNTVLKTVATNQSWDDVDDRRLKQWIQGSSISESMHDGQSLPTLNLTFASPDQMAKTVASLSNMPKMEKYWLGPWQSPQGISNSMTQLRERLSESLKVDWLSKDEQKEWNKRAEKIVLDRGPAAWEGFFEQRKKLSNKRRTEWFQRQLNDAKGEEKLLLEAVQNWYLKEGTANRLSLDDSIPEGILEQLGRIQPGNPLYKTCLNLQVSQQERLFVNLYLDKSPDPAAALDSILRWLEEAGAIEIKLSFLELKP